MSPSPRGDLYRADHWRVHQRNRQEEGKLLAGPKSFALAFIYESSTAAHSRNLHHFDPSATLNHLLTFGWLLWISLRLSFYQLRLCICTCAIRRGYTHSWVFDYVREGYITLRHLWGRWTCSMRSCGMNDSEMRYMYYIINTQVWRCLYGYL